MNNNVILAPKFQVGDEVLVKGQGETVGTITHVIYATRYGQAPRYFYTDGVESFIGLHAGYPESVFVSAARLQHSYGGNSRPVIR